MRSLLFRIVLVTCWIVTLPTRGVAGPITIEFGGDSPDSFIFQASHGLAPFELTDSHPPGGFENASGQAVPRTFSGAFWMYDIEIITNYPGVVGINPNEIEGTIRFQHILPPPGPEHPETGAGGLVTFTFAANLANAPPDPTDPANDLPLIIPMAVAVPHGGHVDYYEFILEVDPVGTGQVIEQWFLTVRGVHVPEPATLTLVGVNALGGLLYGWRRRKRAA